MNRNKKLEERAQTCRMCGRPIQKCQCYLYSDNKKTVKKNEFVQATFEKYFNTE